MVDTKDLDWNEGFRSGGLVGNDERVGHGWVHGLVRKEVCVLRVVDTCILLHGMGREEDGME